MLISVVFAGRGDSSYASALGSFACQLPLRVDLSQIAIPFGDLVKSIDNVISDHVRYARYLACLIGSHSQHRFKFNILMDVEMEKKVLLPQKESFALF